MALLIKAKESEYVLLGTVPTHRGDGIKLDVSFDPIIGIENQLSLDVDNGNDVYRFEAVIEDSAMYFNIPGNVFCFTGDYRFQAIIDGVRSSILKVYIPESLSGSHMAPSTTPAELIPYVERCAELEDSTRQYCESAEQYAEDASEAAQYVDGITATGEVASASTGTPTVTVEKRIVDEHFDFHFVFDKIKGARGQQGIQGPPGETGNGIASIELHSTVGKEKTYKITYTDGTHYYYTVMDGEVTYDDFNPVKTDVSNINAYLGFYSEDVAGLQVDFENKTFTRLAGAVGKNQGSDFDVFPMYGGRRRCNVADDGTINAYYGDEGYTEDGTNGQVMVYQPKFYYMVAPVKKEPNTTSGLGYHLRKVNYYVSSVKHDGFKTHPAFFDNDGNEVDYILLSAYEGCMWDASQNKYINDSVDESIAYAAGDLLCSIHGKKPISGLRDGMGTKANFEAMSNNRGAGWHLETIKATSANQLLMIIEIGMMNTQTGVGKGIDSITDNSSYNCSSLTGSTASIGNGTGSATSTVNEIGGNTTTETASGKVSITYRGVENPWGNIWKCIQGVNIWGDGSMAGGQPFVCDNLTDFNESSHSDHYHGVGFTLANADGYIKAMGYGNPDFDWLLMPSEVGGDSSLPVGDYLYRTTNLNGYRIAHLGGNWNRGGIAGGFCWYCSYGVGNRFRVFGGRLVYIPQGGNA